MFTTHHMLHFMCRVSCVTCYYFFMWSSYFVEGLLSTGPTPSNFFKSGQFNKPVYKQQYLANKWQGFECMLGFFLGHIKMSHSLPILYWYGEDIHGQKVGWIKELPYFVVSNQLDWISTELLSEVLMTQTIYFEPPPKVRVLETKNGIFWTV